MSDPFDRMTDEQLALLAQQGSDQAIGCLIARYLPMAAARAAGYYDLGMEQDDLVQEGLLGLWNAIRSFDAGREVRFSTYAAQCVSNRIRSEVRKALSPRQAPLRNYVTISPEEEDGVGLPQGENPEATFIRKEDRQLRSCRMKSLLSRREWLVLEEFLKGASYQEISEHLCISPKAVDNAMQRVRRKLQAV